MSPEYVRPHVKAQKMGWLSPSPDGIAMCQGRGVQRHEKERTANEDTIIGVDLAKNVFQLHGATMTGHLSFRKKLTRSRFRQFMAGQPPTVVVV